MSAREGYQDPTYQELDRENRRLRAEVERMRPVIEAARELTAADTAMNAESHGTAWVVWDAAEARLYAAVSALDAGEQAQ